MDGQPPAKPYWDSRPLSGSENTVPNCAPGAGHEGVRVLGEGWSALQFCANIVTARSEGHRRPAAWPQPQPRDKDQGDKNNDKPTALFSLHSPQQTSPSLADPNIPPAHRHRSEVRESLITRMAGSLIKRSSNFRAPNI
ncbi:Ovochymase-1 [Frankliniella fusca]|uniref:Ovochymase-1 n=1 Tax=Frankliniella fusca TaxID=407009 RepID=A0AAE1LK04_9NEOP|nr:Ovochymase-1 [Frankliniella fusca]